jgi:hypothetical protein
MKGFQRYKQSAGEVTAFSQQNPPQPDSCTAARIRLQHFIRSPSAAHKQSGMVSPIALAIKLTRTTGRDVHRDGELD